MHSQYSVRAANESDTAAILDLVARTLGTTNPRDAAFWKWKHYGNPFGESPCLVAEADGRVVALRAFMQWRWCSGAHEIRAMRAVDTATAPDWQGRGIFTQLTRELCSRVETLNTALVFNTPNKRSKPGYLKMGWQVVGPTPLMVKALKPLALLKLLRRCSDAPDDERGRDWGLSIDSLLDSPVVENLNGNTSDWRLSTQRSRSYLGWRYRDIPGIIYRSLWSSTPNAHAGLVVRIKRRRGLSELRITELLTDGSQRGTKLAADLICQASSRQSADVATAVAQNGTPEYEALRRAGFVKAHRWGPVLTVRVLSQQPHVEFTRRRQGWRLSAGDLELF